MAGNVPHIADIFTSVVFNPRSPWGERHQLRPTDIHIRDFNPRSPWGERLFQSDRFARIWGFQSTLPVGGATLNCVMSNLNVAYFNPRSPWGERHGFNKLSHADEVFQSTLPVGGATGDRIQATMVFEFQSTLPVGGATHCDNTAFWLTIISIHAPRGGSDRLKPVPHLGADGISIHAPRGGSDSVINFLFHGFSISIHAPRGGSDRRLHGHVVYYCHFNPRSPWGERPISVILPCAGSNFNPRSPWGERPQSPRLCNPHRDFNPRSPWGERLYPDYSLYPELTFQSTLPVGGATVGREERVHRRGISIHAPRGGSDWLFRLRSSIISHFNPRSPWGERL